MSSFGVTTPIVAMVLSIFMGGLALGSWTGGRLALPLAQRSAAAPLRAYAVVELINGSSGILVPLGFRWGHAVLSRAGEGIAWGSASHHLASGAWIAVVLIPFTAAMGATFPLGMAALRPIDPDGSARSFSYLYLANVIGAAAGTVISALVLIELLGFRGTLWVAASGNVLLAAVAFTSARSAVASRIPGASVQETHRAVRSSPTARGAGLLGLLFLTGLTSMALEVVWVRQLTPFLGTVVYAFAMILAVYLLATSVGSALYRRWSAATWSQDDVSRARGVWLAAGCAALLALAGADPRLGAPGIGWAAFARVLVGVAPFSAAMGFLTPLLVDRWSSGSPQRAGTAYAVNVIGCVLGPLLSSFVLLPWIGERWALVSLSVPLFAAGVLGARRAVPRIRPLAGSAALVLALLAGTRDFESMYPQRVVKTDATATVIAAGTGMKKELLVNGYGMTTLSSITKTIAHFPMAFLPDRPRSVLVVCFGMGTSFRSAVSWGVPTTGVELIPSVPDLFPYFHADAASVVAQPGARIVVDDGRRFLERTTDTYDVIAIDPPPPVEAAGSSLLYSREFYAAVRARLRPGGICQQWLSGGNPAIVPSIARSLTESFRYVRVFGSIEHWGVHFLASDRPLPPVTADVLAAKLPPPALRDLLEWEPHRTARSFFETILRQEIPITTVLAADPGAAALTDDRPVNEYYLLRTTFGARSSN
jgi:spermidine synthase